MISFIRASIDRRIALGVCAYGFAYLAFCLILESL
jgi:hypothetical protein